MFYTNAIKNSKKTFTLIKNKYIWLLNRWEKAIIYELSEKLCKLDTNMYV
jgi:hypothetical protein